MDFAAYMRELLDRGYPQAERVRVVMDNTRPSALCAADARASWLNMAQIEIGVLRGQCLNRRIDNRECLMREIAAWERQSNAAGARVEWMFTTEKARAKMGRAYPTPSPNLDLHAKES